VTGPAGVNLAFSYNGDVDSHRGTVFVRHGKGLRDRVVPVGGRALLWVDK
jgi:integrase/recombinase XerD